MRRFLLVAALAAVPALTQGQASPAPRWRFGIDVNAPARLLNVNENVFPDSNGGHSDLGIGVGVVAERLWRLRNEKAYWSALGRIASAAAKATQGGTTFEPGRAFLIDVGLRVGRAITTPTTLFGGVALSHWTGPDETAPFTGLGGLLFGAEAGANFRMGASSPWRVSATANVTRINGDDLTEVQTGFVWRFLAGVTRDY